MYKIISCFFFFTFAFNVSAQCRITKVEYESIMAETDVVDPIVGLWKLQGETRLYRGDSLVFEQDDPFLDFWYIIPSAENSYKVCHTDYTHYQDFTAEFSRVDTDDYQNIYEYTIQYTTEDTVRTHARLIDVKDPDMSIDRMIMYQLSPPFEKALEAGAKVGEELEWTFYWTPQRVDSFYYYMERNVNIDYEMMDSLFANKEWTTQERTELENIHNNEFTQCIRKAIDDGSIHAYPGGDVFAEDLNNDRFTILNTEQVAPNRTIYNIIFDNWAYEVWAVEFELDYKYDLKKLIAVNRSIYHNRRSMKAYLESLNKAGIELWR